MNFSFCRYGCRLCLNSRKVLADQIFTIMFKIFPNYYLNKLTYKELATNTIESSYPYIGESTFRVFSLNLNIFLSFFFFHLFKQTQSFLVEQDLFSGEGLCLAGDDFIYLFVSHFWSSCEVLGITLEGRGYRDVNTHHQELAGE